MKKIIIILICLLLIVGCSKNPTMEFEDCKGCHNIAIGKNTGSDWINESYRIDINCRTVFEHDWDKSKFIDLSKEMCIRFNELAKEDNNVGYGKASLKETTTGSSCCEIGYKCDCEKIKDIEVCVGREACECAFKCRNVNFTE